MTAARSGEFGTEPTVSVVVCTYSDGRWFDLSRAITSASSQLEAGDELILVVDHNPPLLERAHRELGVPAIANSGSRGLSGARNTGVRAATGDVVVFLDDDAVPRQGWLSSYRKSLRDRSVGGVGGAVFADWEGGSRPPWFPEEFGWVVGCDYRGLPSGGSEIRNPIGASMALRRFALLEVGGFSEAVGRVGSIPVGCEETDICIRIRRREPALRFVRDVDSKVDHVVPKARQRTSYFVSRCYHEGRSKAVLARTAGTQAGLASERAYVTKVLPTGVVRNVRMGLRGDYPAFARAAMIPLGLISTGVGYLGARATSVSSVSGADGGGSPRSRIVSVLTGLVQVRSPSTKRSPSARPDIEIRTRGES